LFGNPKKIKKRKEIVVVTENPYGKEFGMPKNVCEGM
jgi:hypothetical protein